jgi:hypothetical protein
MSFHFFQFSVLFQGLFTPVCLIKFNEFLQAGSTLCVMEEGGGIRDNMARWQTWLWLAKGISAGFYVFSRDRSGHGPSAATGPECLLPGLALAPKHPMPGVAIKHECPKPRCSSRKEVSRDMSCHFTGLSYVIWPVLIREPRVSYDKYCHGIGLSRGHCSQYTEVF